MGTNFYRVSKKYRTRVHICKRSAGWVIIFDHNKGRYYPPSRLGLEEFLKKDGYEIQDEYGKTYTSEEFWKMVQTWNSSSRPDGSPLWNSERYTAWEKSNDPAYNVYFSTKDQDWVKEHFGVETSYGDFEVDSLTFSIVEKFS